MMFAHDCGYKEEIHIKCPHCGAEVEAGTVEQAVIALAMKQNHHTKHIDTIQNDMTDLKEVKERLDKLEDKP